MTEKQYKRQIAELKKKDKVLFGRRLMKRFLRHNDDDGVLIPAKKTEKFFHQTFVYLRKKL